MTDHVHDWKPAPNQSVVYLCACGAKGWRHTHGLDRGKVMAYKSTKRLEPTQRVRVVGGEGLGHVRHGRRGPGSY